MAGMKKRKSASILTRGMSFIAGMIMVLRGRLVGRMCQRPQGLPNTLINPDPVFAGTLVARRNDAFAETQRTFGITETENRAAG